MNTEISTVDREPLVIRRPLVSEWHSVPITYMRFGGETHVKLQVEVSKGISTIARVILPDDVAMGVYAEGRTRRWFVYSAIMTTEGPGIKVDKIEINGVPYELSV